ncbi:hypothetical protein I551_5149 [Mycobacterium ulcerans str. Harvey]|uniref:Uncharacterized protein n=1 Tax=Mycobacterium ulcerans str. Harvey TaxID=1299332 RepID=A0ABP3ADR0_MYCUL|nr:hypothetical protein I551_5149 [Mycobacterium ulcerans str. Harvey]
MVLEPDQPAAGAPGCQMPTTTMPLTFENAGAPPPGSLSCRSAVGQTTRRISGSTPFHQIHRAAYDLGAWASNTSICPRWVATSRWPLPKNRGVDGMRSPVGASVSTG